MDAQPANFSRRFKTLVTLLKSGDRNNVELVVATLRKRQLEVGLSGGEQRMLHKAEAILDPPPASDS
jgi:RNA polymerase-interacting CarD/CdnL/TRCF family regulator